MEEMGIYVVQYMECNKYSKSGISFISNNNKMHYLSNDLKCEGFGTNEFTLSYTSTKRGVETLRDYLDVR